MPDDPTKRRPQDASRISVEEPWEVEYWSRKLGTTPDELRAAVQAVGHSVKAVEQYFGQKAARTAAAQ